MKIIFASKEFPFLLTVLFALVGYNISEVSKSILNSPSVEYSFKISKQYTSNDTIYKEYEYTVSNITNDKSFQNLTINFKSSGISLKIFDPSTIAVAPASLHFTNPESLDKRLLIFTIIRFQPGDKYRLIFKSNCDIEDKQLNPYIYLTTDSTVRIIKKSFTTWIVKNYLAINTILIAFWIILILFYLLKLSTHEDKTLNS